MPLIAVADEPSRIAAAFRSYRPTAAVVPAGKQSFKDSNRGRFLHPDIFRIRFDVSVVRAVAPSACGSLRRARQLPRSTCRASALAS